MRKRPFADALLLVPAVAARSFSYPGPGVLTGASAFALFGIAPPLPCLCRFATHCLDAFQTGDGRQPGRGQRKRPTTRKRRTCLSTHKAYWWSRLAFRNCSLTFTDRDAILATVRKRGQHAR